jgi:hypothetical protein
MPYSTVTPTGACGVWMAISRNMDIKPCGTLFLSSLVESPISIAYRALWKWKVLQYFSRGYALKGPDH